MMNRIVNLKNFIFSKKKSKGITLIEMMVVLGIFSMVLISITTYVWMSLRAQNKSVKHILAQNSARKALLVATAEIRGSMYSDAGAYPIVEATANTITFYTNIDEDINAERVRYFMDSSELKRGVIEPQGDPPNYNGVEQINTLARYITNPGSIFTYYDQEYDGTSNPLTFPVNKSVIKLVKFYLTIDVDTQRLPESVSVSTGVQLRNLKENL